MFKLSRYILKIYVYVRLELAKVRYSGLKIVMGLFEILNGVIMAR